MDLNPREAVVDQEPSYPSEQEEEPIDAVIVPENIVGAAMDSLNRLAADPGGPEPAADDELGVLVRVVHGTHCFYTGKRPHRDQRCGDLV